jgi:thiamine-phosphate pyrophosphorylase
MRTRILRLVDANYNRALEGLRVCEDIARFIKNDKNLTKSLKYLRHELCDTIRHDMPLRREELLACRDVACDLGKGSTPAELRRNSYGDIFAANIQRVKESLRVLEEFSKIVSRKQATLRLKSLRYLTYRLEKKAAMAAENT